MEIVDLSRKRKNSDEGTREALQKFLGAKKLKIETGESSERAMVVHARNNNNNNINEMNNKNNGAVVRVPPLQLNLPTLQLNQGFTQAQAERIAFNIARNQVLMQNLNDDEPPRKLFTLLDIKDDETSKEALEARRRLRFTNIHALIVPEEKLFLITCCDHFHACYEELIEYIVAIGELRNKQIIVEHCYYKMFMHTLKMFYYTEKGWRFNVDFEEFFSGFLRKFKEPIIEKMRAAYAQAKAARDAARQKPLEVIVIDD